MGRTLAGRTAEDPVALLPGQVGEQAHVPRDLGLVFWRVQLASLVGQVIKELGQGLLPTATTFHATATTLHATLPHFMRRCHPSCDGYDVSWKPHHVSCARHHTSCYPVALAPFLPRSVADGRMKRAAPRALVCARYRMQARPLTSRAGQSARHRRRRHRRTGRRARGRPSSGRCARARAMPAHRPVAPA
jgi:hypothetical protein